MIINPGVVGIDVSKAHLDIFDASAGHRQVANRAEDFTVEVRRFAEASAFVLLEATGNYDQALRQALSTAGVRFARVNPARARDFARAAGFLAKTDKVDARMLAAMAQSLPQADEPAPDPERDRLAGLHKRRDQLVAMRKQERTRIEDRDDDPVTAASLVEHIAWLSREIAAIEARIKALIKASPAFAAKARLLASVPGVGLVTLTTLLALAPELGSRSPKQIAALAGLAPLNRDSGTSRGKRSIRGGRKRLRDALYLAALTASRSQSRFAVFYRSLRAAGKAPKQALIALARKLLVTLNALLRDGVPFTS
jgi:transposase